MKLVLPGGITLMMSVGDGKGCTARRMNLLSPERSTTKRRSTRLAFDTKNAGLHHVVGSVTGSMMLSSISSRIILLALSTQCTGILRATLVKVGVVGMSLRSVTVIGGPSILLLSSFVTMVSLKVSKR